ncbi:MAG: hypothetical protein ABI376_03675 [Caulobacteraceae bacterium]
MKRNFLAAAVAAGPILAVMAGAAGAETQITTATSTPVATATVKGGGPDDITITTSGSVNPTQSAAAVTLNSNNSVTNAGSISFSNIDKATGILVDGGNTGQVTATGRINVNETYVAPADPNGDGLLNGAFAQGSSRIGIDVVGGAPFAGAITASDVINIQGNDSEGILIAAPVSGNVTQLTVTGTGAAATVQNGFIAITGDRTVGFQVTPTGGIGGNLRITSIAATGVGTRAVDISGPVGGTVNISGVVTATGYRTTTRPNNPAISVLYRATQLQQGGAAVGIAADLGGGLIVSAPPPILSTTNLDQDGDGVPDKLQTRGVITSFGASPALQLGAVGHAITLGNVGAGANAYGLIVDGGLTANGVFDQGITPNLPAPVAATALLVGVDGGGAVIIGGGVRVGGVIYAQAYQADATAIRLGSGADTPTLVNGGSILATSTQVNDAANLTPVNVTAIRIDAGANVAGIVNSAGITANITGAGGVGGTATAILDRSGSVTSIANTGTISSQLTQTLITQPIPGVTTAIDISHGTAPQSIVQSAPAPVPGATVFNAAFAYAAGSIVSDGAGVYQAIGAVTAGTAPPSDVLEWRQIGATSPSITGSIYFGAGGSTLQVNSGVIFGNTIDLGAGVNTVTVAGDDNTAVVGSLKDEGGQLTLNVVHGTLSDTNPLTVAARGVNVGAHGILFVSADPANATNTRFVTTGSSTFEQGAQVGLTLRSVQSPAIQTYVILQTVPGQGTLTAGTFPSGLLNNAPYLYNANTTFAPAADPATQPSEILLTVTRKTQAQLGFNNAEAAALDPVLAAIPRDANIQAAILAQTTQAGLKAAYDQLLPDQGQGLFEAIDAAAQAVSSLTSTRPDAGTRVVGSSLWVQEVNERVNRSGLQTEGSNARLLGLVGGFDRAGPGGGAAGVTLAYFNAQEANTNSAVGQNVVASMVELGAYYRRSVGGLTVAARGAAGYSWFSGKRRFASGQAANTAFSSWNGGFLDGHLGVAYERNFGRIYGGPSLSLDYLGLREGVRTDRGGGPGFDLTVASRTSTRLSGAALLVVGAQWGRAAWLRSEIRVGYREIISGSIGDTVANFDGGAPFILEPDNGGGWATMGFSLKGGSQFSYLALEGDADFRSGEQRYDVRVAGRSTF